MRLKQTKSLNFHYDLILWWKNKLILQHSICVHTWLCMCRRQLLPLMLIEPSIALKLILLCHKTIHFHTQYISTLNLLVLKTKCRVPSFHQNMENRTKLSKREESLLIELKNLKTPSLWTEWKTRCSCCSGCGWSQAGLIHEDYPTYGWAKGTISASSSSRESTLLFYTTQSSWKQLKSVKRKLQRNMMVLSRKEATTSIV